MKTIYNATELYDRFWELVERDDTRSNANGQLTKLYHWLYDNNFLRNLNRFDYECLVDEDFEHLSLPILRNHKIAFGINVWDNYAIIGIDPSNCFNKVSQCSIVARLPLSKREETAFYNVLNKIMDKKSTFSKDWFKQASTSWYGSYAKFGNI